MGRRGDGAGREPPRRRERAPKPLLRGPHEVFGGRARGHHGAQGQLRGPVGGLGDLGGRRGERVLADGREVAAPEADRVVVVVDGGGGGVEGNAIAAAAAGLLLRWGKDRRAAARDGERRRRDGVFGVAHLVRVREGRRRGRLGEAHGKGGKKRRKDETEKRRENFETHHNFRFFFLQGGLEQ